MAATFPTSPTDGQTVEVAGRYFTWNATAGVWQNIGAASGTASVSNLTVSGITTVSVGSAAAPSITPNGDSNTGIFFPEADTIAFSEGGSESLRITSTGNVLPGANGSQDLGSSSLRWANLYVNDLNLSNGIGDYTIVEGEEDLFLYNNKTGKVFKFAIIEVDPGEATPKAKKD